MKHNSKGQIEGYKARLLAKRYTQVYGVNYKINFSPKSKMSTVRAIISLGTNDGWILHQYDV